MEQCWKHDVDVSLLDIDVPMEVEVKAGMFQS